MRRSFVCRLALGLALVALNPSQAATPAVAAHGSGVSYELSRDGRWVTVRGGQSPAFVSGDGVRMGWPPRKVAAERWYAWDPVIVQAARTYGLDPVFIKALLYVESGLAPRALSRKGAEGIGQLMPATAARLGVQDAYDPSQAIWGTAAYLRRTSDTFQTQNMVILAAAYNSGDRAVASALRRADREGDTRLLQLVPRNPETPGYVKNVLWAWDRIHRGAR